MSPIVLSLATVVTRFLYNFTAYFSLLSGTGRYELHGYGYTRQADIPALKLGKILLFSALLYYKFSIK